MRKSVQYSIENFVLFCDQAHINTYYQFKVDNNLKIYQTCCFSFAHTVVGLHLYINYNKYKEFYIANYLLPMYLYRCVYYVRNFTFILNKTNEICKLMSNRII